MIRLALLFLVLTNGWAEAAAIQYAFTEVASDQSTSSASYADITGAEIASGSFTTGKQYLVLVKFDIGNSSANAVNGAILTNSSNTPLAELECTYVRANPLRNSCAFLTVWTAPGSEGLKVRAKTSGGTVVVDQIQLFAMNLTDNLSAGAHSGACGDWVSVELATDSGSLTTSPANGATVTCTPATAGTYLALYYAQIDAGDLTNSIIVNAVSSGDVNNTISANTTVTSASSIMATVISRTYALTNASNTFTVQGASSGSSSHVMLHSRVFLLRLNAFRNFASVFTAADTATLSTTNYATNIQTLDITPDIQGPVLIGSSWGYDIGNATDEGEFSLRVDGTPVPADQETDNYQFNVGTANGDEIPLSAITMVPSMTAASHTIDLVGSAASTGGSPTVQDRSLWAFSMELASAGVPRQMHQYRQRRQ